MGVGGSLALAACAPAQAPDTLGPTTSKVEAAPPLPLESAPAPSAMAFREVAPDPPAASEPTVPVSAAEPAAGPSDASEQAAEPTPAAGTALASPALAEAVPAVRTPEASGSTEDEPTQQVAGVGAVRPLPAVPTPRGTLVDGGIASTYGTGDGFQGNRTACGQIFDTYVVQVAHKTLPCGTRLRIQDVATGRSVEAEVTDRGPYIPGRVVDLSWAAYQQLDPRGPGLLDVKVYQLP